jgi:hypothetical protein
MTKCDKTTKKSPLPKIFKCECGKIYKYRQGFHRHLKTCSEKRNMSVVVPTCDNTDYKSLFLKSMARSEDLMNLLVTQNRENKHENKDLMNLLQEQ